MSFMTGYIFFYVEYELKKVQFNCTEFLSKEMSTVRFCYLANSDLSDRAQTHIEVLDFSIV